LLHSLSVRSAGKTTQIRILAGELEPTTGDVVKSSKDVRTAVLRQEFIDELVLERTLREEFLSVFDEENKILEEIKATESALENTPPDEVDTMQQILDRMQELQNLAEDKAVYTLDSRIKKIMDLMGFTDDEGDDLVASFSGGWKMRIGLGKALLRDPSVLLLDEPVRNYVPCLFHFEDWFIVLTNNHVHCVVDKSHGFEQCRMVGSIFTTAKYSHGNCQS
jgi:ATP-binding cassette, subfamily F, member 3